MEEMADAYFEELNGGQFRTGENWWMYLGFCCLIGIGVLAASLMEWRMDGQMLQNAMPGKDVASQTVYVTLFSGLSVELKSLMYVGIFGLMVVLFVCYVMASR